MALKMAGLAFGVLALVAGVLQLWAFGAGSGARYLVLGVFASSVGACVIAAVWGRRRR